MSQDYGEKSDRLSQDTEYEGAALGTDDPDIYDDYYIVDIALRLAPECESDFSDFTDEEEKKELTET